MLLQEGNRAEIQELQEIDQPEGLAELDEKSLEIKWNGLTEEQREKILQLGCAVAEAGSKAMENLAPAIDALVKVIKETADFVKEYFANFCKATEFEIFATANPEELKKLGTPREVYLMYHARRWRTRKKYINRLKKRYFKQKEGGADAGI